MSSLASELLKSLLDSLRDLAPIVGVIAFFQIFVLGGDLPQETNLLSILWGTLLVVMGLTFFVQGLKLGLFPIGENMGWEFANKGSLIWVLVFAFALGFGTTVAEPALIAVADEAAKVAAEGEMIADTDDVAPVRKRLRELREQREKLPTDLNLQASLEQAEEEFMRLTKSARDSYAEGLRYTVALSVGIAIVVGVLRILRGWPIQYLIIVGYLGVVIMTAFAPKEIIGIAYDSGGVTTSTITVPLVTALGVGLASSIEGRNPMTDGFGLIAFASLTPMIFVMGYGMLI